jgi:signal transduction histidine kinase/ligand-binding sensor domain-containing protein
MNCSVLRRLPDLRTILCLAAALPLWAAAPAENTSFHVRHWQAQDGVPFTKVTSLVQTRDGFLWIGSLDGLARFDGHRFVQFQPGSSSGWTESGVSALYESPEGTLWIGHVGGKVSAYQGGKVRAKEPPPGWVGNRTAYLGSDLSGDVWSLSDSGLLTRMQDGLMLRPEPGTAAGLYGMTCSNRGTIWVASGGRIYELRGASLERIAAPAGTDWVQGIGAALDGGLWAISNNHLFKYSDAQWTRTPGILPTQDCAVHNLVETRTRFLVGTTTQIGAFVIPLQNPAAATRFDKENAFGSNWVRSALEDSEGNLWFGAGSNGLFRVSRTKFRSVVAPDGWQGASVLTAMASADDGYWIGTEGAGLYHVSGDGRWSTYGPKSGFQSPYVWSLASTAESELYAGTWGNGVFALGPNGLAKPPGLQNLKTPVPALLASRRGGLWVGTREGLGYFSEGKMHWIEADGSSRIGDVRAILEAEDGVVWFGSHGDGLGRLEGGRVRHFREADGLPSDFVQSLYLDPDGSLWIGTKHKGLSRYKAGAFSTINVARGLTDDDICSILDDRNGDLWMSSHGGIFRVSKVLLNACADGKVSRVECINYGIEDGLPSLVSTGALQPTAFNTKDGHLVFVTERGLAIANPAQTKPNSNPPPVIIETVRAGERLIDVGNDSVRPVVLQPSERRIEIAYTGLSFTAPERVRFKRRLEGLEVNWVNVNDERSASYAYVPPGRYVFRVIAANNNNVWNTAGCTLAIVVLPHVWETSWFKVLAVLFLVAATGAIIRALVKKRMQRKLAKLERLNAIEMERSRIARDMHDDLGSQLTRITMLSDSTLKGLGSSEQAIAGLRQVYETAREATRAMDEIVWAVNPRHDSLESMIWYFEKFSQDSLGAAGIRCRLEMPANVPNWQPSAEIRHNLFLAFKEALTNAIRHSGADTVTVSLEVDQNWCRLCVSDNGRGSPEYAAAAGTGARDRIASGNGIPGMRERMDQIGGRLEIVAEQGGGLLVVLQVPTGTPGK